ncbi:MAG: hypothetical protein HOF72_12685, partial [Planctomycetaceae bacterium]|nr:hypothetical protein [Planctomycetaceae bacterium]
MNHVLQIAAVVGILWMPFLQRSTMGADHWNKHIVMELGHCNTAVALDANGDHLLDVIASFNGTVSLFIAPTWQQQYVLHRFPVGNKACIHSEVLDVDGDGDLDWAGTIANQHPFWLE